MYPRIARGYKFEVESLIPPMKALMPPPAGRAGRARARVRPQLRARAPPPGDGTMHAIQYTSIIFKTTHYINTSHYLAVQRPNRQ